MRTYFLSAAICHQTHNLHHPDLNLWGWEYMEHGFLELVRKRHPLLNPGYMSICSQPDIAGLLQETFSPTGKKEGSSLDRIEERSAMWLNICSFVKNNFQGSISRMIDSSEGRLISDGKGLYERLSGLSAFADPEMKKLTFFIKLATDAGILNIKDPENLIPIMDYHMQRVLLRTGCVVVTDKELAGKLSSRTPVDSDAPVRSACIEAMKHIAEASGKNLLAMNDFFWPLGRSCCHEITLCRDKSCSKNPCTLATILNLEQHDSCILQNECKGAFDDTYLRLWEPVVETSYY